MQEAYDRKSPLRQEVRRVLTTKAVDGWAPYQGCEYELAQQLVMTNPGLMPYSIVDIEIAIRAEVAEYMP